MADFSKITGTSISFNRLAIEHGNANADGSISLGNYYKGGTRVASTTDNTSVPASGTVSISNFTGSSGYYPGDVYASGNNITGSNMSAQTYGATVDKLVFNPNSGLSDSLPGIAGAIPANSMKSGCTITSTTNSINGTAGMTLLTRTSGDIFKGYWKYTLPFTVNFLGRTVDTAYITSDSYVFFRNSSWTTPSYKIANDLYPSYTELENALVGGSLNSLSQQSGLTFGLAISPTKLIGPSNHSIPTELDTNYQATEITGNKVYSLVSGTTPNRTARLRFEGFANVVGTGGGGFNGTDTTYLYTGSSLTYVAPTSTGLTLFTSSNYLTNPLSYGQLGSGYEGYLNVTLPFSTYIGDVLTNSIKISTHFYVADGNNINSYYASQNLADGNQPAFPAIAIFPDRWNTNQLAHGVLGTAPNRTYKIYWNGAALYQNSSNYAATMTFYENDVTRVDIHAQQNHTTNYSNNITVYYSLNSTGGGTNAVGTLSMPSTTAGTTAGFKLVRSTSTIASNHNWEIVLNETSASNGIIDVHLGTSNKLLNPSPTNRLHILDEFQPFSLYEIGSSPGFTWTNTLAVTSLTLYDSNKGRLTGLTTNQSSVFTANNTSKRVTTTSAVTRTTGGIIDTPTLSGTIQVGTDSIVPNVGGIYGVGGAFTLNTLFNTSNTLYGVVENGANAYVAVGTNGTWLNGSNGSSWITRTSGTAANLYDVCYGAASTEYVAVGASGTIVKNSASGTGVVQTSAQPSVTLTGVCYSAPDDKFVAVGLNKSLTSTASAVAASTGISLTSISANGTTATAISTTAHYLVSGMTVTISGATAFNGTTGAITVLNSTTFTYASALTSTNSSGATATPTTSSNTVTFTTQTSAPFAVGSTIYASTGTAYTVIACTTTTVKYYSATALTVGTVYSQNTISTSADGTTWAQVAAPQPTGAVPYNLRGVAYSAPGNNLVITASSGTGTIATLTFAARSAAPFAVGDTIVVSGMGFTAPLTGYNGTYTVTACTTTTVSYANATTGTTTGTAAGATADLFVAVGDGGKIQTSPDAVTWTAQTSGTANNLYGVCYNHFNKRWVAVGASGTIITSPDGITWTTQTSGTANTLWRVAYNPVRSQLVAVGNSDTILYSTYAGTTWTLSTAVTSGASLYAVCSAVTDNRFAIVGSPNQAYVTISDYVVAPFSSGDSVTVAGVTPSGYNGTYTLTSASSTNLSYINGTGSTVTVQGNIKPSTTPKWTKIISSGSTTYALRDNGQVWWWGVNPNVGIPAGNAWGTGNTQLTRIDTYYKFIANATELAGGYTNVIDTANGYTSEPLLLSIYARPLSTATFKDICKIDNPRVAYIDPSISNVYNSALLIGTNNKPYPIGIIWDALPLADYTLYTSNQQSDKQWGLVNNYGFPRDTLTKQPFTFVINTLTNFNGTTGLNAIAHPTLGNATAITLPFTTTIAGYTGTAINVGSNGIVFGGTNNYSTAVYANDSQEFTIGRWAGFSNFVMPPAGMLGISSGTGLLYTGIFGTAPNRSCKILRLANTQNNTWAGGSGAVAATVDSGLDSITLVFSGSNALDYYQGGDGNRTIGCGIKFSSSFAGITAGTLYWIVYDDGVRIKVSTTPGGTPVNLTTATPAANTYITLYDVVSQTTLYENGGTTAAGTIDTGIVKISYTNGAGCVYGYNNEVNYDPSINGINIGYGPLANITCSINTGANSITTSYNYIRNFTIPPSTPAILNNQNINYAIAGTYHGYSDSNSLFSYRINKGFYYLSLTTTGQLYFMGSMISLDYAIDNNTFGYSSIDYVVPTLYNSGNAYDAQYASNDASQVITGITWKHIGAYNGVFYALDTQDRLYVWGALARHWYTPSSGGKYPTPFVFVNLPTYLHGNINRTYQYSEYEKPLLVYDNGQNFRYTQVYLQVNDTYSTYSNVQGFLSGFGITTESLLVTWGRDSYLYNKNADSAYINGSANVVYPLSVIANGAIQTCNSTTGVFGTYFSNPGNTNIVISPGMPIRFIDNNTANSVQFFNTTGISANKIYYIKTTSGTNSANITISTTRFGSTFLPLGSTDFGSGFGCNIEIGPLDCKSIVEFEQNNSDRTAVVGVAIIAKDGHQYSFGRETGWGVLYDESTGASARNVNDSSNPITIKPVTTNQAIRYGTISTTGTKYIIK